VRILRLMGCDSRQFASMERYLLRACESAVTAGHEFHVAYDAPPKSDEFVGRLGKAGGTLLVLGVDGSVPSFLGRLHSTVRRLRIDLLHAYFTPTCHHAMAYAWATGMPGRLRTSANMPLTVRRASGLLTPLALRRFAATQRALARFPRRILALSEAMAEEFAELGIAGDRVRVVNGGVDETYFRPASAEERRAARSRFDLDGEVCVATTARMVPVKGLDLLLEAAARLPDVRFLLAGDGPLRSDLEARAGALGVSDRVGFVGQLADARELLAAADIVALPTRSEGLSNSVMEAMAEGLPVVASDIPANAEVVADGVNGVLFRVGDAEALAAGIRRLAGDEALRSRLGAESRRKVEERFNVGRRVAEELAVYEELVS
jgi:glycosyltransferase involved in cell wall biosynthesis